MLRVTRRCLRSCFAARMLRKRWRQKFPPPPLFPDMMVACVLASSVRLNRPMALNPLVEIAFPSVARCRRRPPQHPSPANPRCSPSCCSRSERCLDHAPRGCSTRAGPVVVTEPPINPPCPVARKTRTPADEAPPAVDIATLLRKTEPPSAQTPGELLPVSVIVELLQIWRFQCRAHRHRADWRAIRGGAVIKRDFYRYRRKRRGFRWPRDLW